MSKGFFFPLRVKFTLAILVASLIIGGVVVFLGYQIYNRQIIEHYTIEGETLTNVAASIVNWDDLESYIDTGEADEEHDRVLADLRLCRQASEATYIYVVIPHEDQIAFIYDTDEEDTQYDIAETVPWETEFSDYTKEAQDFNQIGPAFFDEEDYGSILSYYTPFYDTEGNFSGYLGIDYNIDDLIVENNRFISQLAIATVLISILTTLIGYFFLRKLIVDPVNTIAHAADEYVSNDIQSVLAQNSITKLEIATGDELEELSDSLKTMEHKIQNHLASLELANHRAETDPLTGILNRASFRNQIEMTLRKSVHGGCFVFMMIDVDRFKSVNDTYGHKVGDEVLIACAQAISGCFRSNDLVARMGGDEFAVFYQSHVCAEDVEKRAEKIMKAVSSLEVIEDYTITLSIGVVAHGVEEKTDYQRLYLEADKALYDVKNDGRNGYKLIFTAQDS